MSLDILLTSFVMIFLLEIGDKTQLLVFGITSRNPHSKIPILLGFVMGIAAVTVIGAIVGEATRNLLPTEFLIVLSGLCFIGIGAYSFVGIYMEWKQKNGRDETEIDQGREEREEETRTPWGIMIRTFALIFLAEFADKTQLAVVSLVINSGDYLSVIIGGVAAMTSLAVLAIMFGDVISRVLPEKAIEIISALVFIVIGSFLILAPA